MKEELDSWGSLRARGVISADFNLLAKSISASHTLSCGDVSALRINKVTHVMQMVEGSPS